MRSKPGPASHPGGEKRSLSRSPIRTERTVKLLSNNIPVTTERGPTPSLNSGFLGDLGGEPKK